jgi:tRNA U55 pseudouridine synthase TruB
MEYLAQLPGVHNQKYPPFSSKPLEGQPLFVHARKGDLGKFELPEHRIEIFTASLVGMNRMTNDELMDEIRTAIGLVKGDFRQDRILHLWEDTLRVLYGMSFDVATVSIHCTSGTYVRTIAHELGQRMGIPALAMRILRTRAGKYKVRGSEK